MSLALRVAADIVHGRWGILLIFCKAHFLPAICLDCLFLDIDIYSSRIILGCLPCPDFRLPYMVTLFLRRHDVASTEASNWISGGWVVGLFHPTKTTCESLKAPTDTHIGASNIDPAGNECLRKLQKRTYYED